MTFMTQVELERQMVEGGIARARRAMAEAESSGNADRNPYAKAVFQDFVEPLAVMIAEAQSTKGARITKAHVEHLVGMEPLEVAFLTVRSALTFMMAAKDEDCTVRKVAYDVGRMVHSECYLSKFKDLEPDLFYDLSNELGRRQSKSTQHRLNYYQSYINKTGLVIDKWQPAARHQVGMYLVQCLMSLGMLYADDSIHDKRRQGEVGISIDPDVLDKITRIKTMWELTRPIYLPCVEQPRDWTGFATGGFHTHGMRRAHPYLVKAPANARDALREHSMPLVYAAINHMQSTRWRVNKPVLEALQAMASRKDFGDVQLLRDGQAPARPAWLDSVDRTADLPPDRAEEFTRWKHSMSAWHTAQKLRTSKHMRYSSLVRVAEQFKDYHELYFVWFADSRGRLYPLAQGLNPQGADMQKGCLTFAEGKPVNNPAARRWFMINGANLWGFDKAHPDAREKWHEDKHDLIMDIANDPMGNDAWTEADNPCQFLAWCLEYRGLHEDPNFLSYLPVYLDGSCNGLQHFSAMLRDEIGGHATNLTHSETMQDVYMRVANKALERMKALPIPCAVAEKWIAHGVPRAAVKRSVMTTPYGVTKATATKNVRKDYLIAGMAACFSPEEYRKASEVLMEHTWAAIGEVVVKSREAMEWLHKAGWQLAKNAEDDACIFWLTPSGFLASQAYYQTEEKKINTVMYGFYKLTIVSETPKSSPSKNGTSLAPNFVHSNDASHLVITVVDFHKTPGRALAAVHDAFGTHAADTQELYEAVRETFVRMYTMHSPLEEFAKYNSISIPLPTKGSLDLDEVHKSLYFFL